MDWIYGEPFRFDCPLFAYELIRRKAFEGFEPSPEVVGADEMSEMGTQLIVVVVMEAFDGRVLDRAVPAFDLATRPGVFDLGETMVDLVLAADPVENVFKGVNVPFAVGELDSIIVQHDVDPVRHGSDQVVQKRGGSHLPGLWVKLDESEFRGAAPSRAFSMPCRATDGNEDIQLAFGSLNLSNINVKVARRVGFELLLYRLVALDLRQTTDVVALQTAVQE